MRTAFIVVLGLAFCFSARTEAQEPRMSNTEVKELYEEMLSGDHYTLCLGRFDIVPGSEPTPCNQGRMNEVAFKFIIAAQRTGIVTVLMDQEFERFKRGESFSWAQSLDMTTRQLLHKVTIALTPKGEAMATVRRDNMAMLRKGKMAVTTIVRNEARRSGVTDYSIVMLRAKADWEPNYKAIQALQGITLADDRKAIVLFKHDPFRGFWLIAASDEANMDGEFTTAYVSRALDAAK